MYFPVQYRVVNMSNADNDDDDDTDRCVAADFATVHSLWLFFVCVVLSFPVYYDFFPLISKLWLTLIYSLFLYVKVSMDNGQEIIKKNIR